MRDLPLPTMPLAELRLRRRPVTLPPALTPPMPETARTRASPMSAESIHVEWARTEDDVRAAQRLRHLVFAQEMGARLASTPGTPAGHDADVFDPYCEHLLVRLRTDDEEEVIGTYRVLTPSAAKRIGGWYSDTEFDLVRLRHMTDRMAELGRSCVHPDHRTGGVIMTLWSALGQFMVRNGLDTMIGCASVSMRDGGHVAASLWNRLEKTHLAPIEHRVRPRLPLPIDDLQQDLTVEPPALIKGYLRCGAKILGAPAWDPDFNTADLPMMLRLQDLPTKYRRHFLEGGA